MLCSRSASFNPILAQFNLLLTPWQGPAILWNRPKIWSKCAPTPLSRWFIISGLIAFPPNTHTHTSLWIVFSWWIVISSDWYRERVGPVVISSLLCLYQVYVDSPLSAAGLPYVLYPLYCHPVDYTPFLPFNSQHGSFKIQKVFGKVIRFEPGSYWSLFSGVWLLKIIGSSRQLRLHDFNDPARGPRASREYAATTVKTANHHPPMATFWWGPQSIWLFIDNKINSERGQQTEWTFLALPYRRFESLFVTLLHCGDFE